MDEISSGIKGLKYIYEFIILKQRFTAGESDVYKPQFCGLMDKINDFIRSQEFSFLVFKQIDIAMLA